VTDPLSTALYAEGEAVTGIGFWRVLLGTLALVVGTVLLANFFFSGAKRIQAAPTAVAATIEPVVGIVLALVPLSRRLTGLGWLGLLVPCRRAGRGPGPT
jgi:drug/metabolite transporter (DMT)-like permease